MAQIIRFNKDGNYGGFTINPKKTLEELKEIKEVDGTVVYEIDDEQLKKVREGYTPLLDDGKITFVKGEAYDAKIELDNKFILKAIGQIVVTKNGRIEAGLPTTEEDAKIANLKAKLR